MTSNTATIINTAGQDLEIVLKSGRQYEHICLSAGKNITVPRKSITDLCMELQQRQLLQII
mgnify:CR=1|jgi:uncharacterized protein|tara:strand:+ start:227 stop:409 length:183 start_codon:yes stop_codon:yes gene_type:complete